MGVGMIISSGGQQWSFQEVPKVFYQVRDTSGEISFCPLETKKTNFFLKFNKKMSNLKIQGGPAPQPWQRQ